MSNTTGFIPFFFSLEARKEYLQEIGFDFLTPDELEWGAKLLVYEEFDLSNNRGGLMSQGAYRSRWSLNQAITYGRIGDPNAPHGELAEKFVSGGYKAGLRSALYEKNPTTQWTHDFVRNQIQLAIFYAQLGNPGKLSLRQQKAVESNWNRPIDRPLDGHPIIEWEGTHYHSALIGGGKSYEMHCASRWKDGDRISALKGFLRFAEVPLQFSEETIALPVEGHASFQEFVESFRHVKTKGMILAVLPEVPDLEKYNRILKIASYINQPGWHKSVPVKVHGVVEYAPDLTDDEDFVKRTRQAISDAWESGVQWMSDESLPPKRRAMVTDWVGILG